MGKQSEEIKNYNFRHYFLRRTNDKLQSVESMADHELEQSQSHLIEKYNEELTQLQRIAAVQNLYHAGPSIMDEKESL